MSKASKNKKTKVPKLTEAEYTAYISSLKTGGMEGFEAPMSVFNAGKKENTTSKKA